MSLPLPRLRPDKIGAIGHIVANFPTRAVVKSMVRTMVEAKVALIEVQIPFSEPSADGPVLMAANHAVLKRGDTVAQSFQLMRELTTEFPVPFVFMTYLNPIFQMGFANFIKKSAAAGARGVIIPDLPLERDEGFGALAKESNFWVVPVIPPNISEERLRVVLKRGSGFIYAVSRTGVTGNKTELGNAQQKFLKRIATTRPDLPIAMGFGLTSAADLQNLKGFADYGIIGSHALRTYEEKGMSGYRRLWQPFSRL